MLTEYEAAVLAKHRAADAPLAQQPPARNRIGAVLLVLSMLSAAGLLYAAFLGDGGHGARATHTAPALTRATPVIHPAATGLPEGVLFLRHPPLASDEAAVDPMYEWRLR